MADNPNEPELIDLGIESSGWEDFQDGLNRLITSLDNLGEKVDSLDYTLGQLNDLMLNGFVTGAEQAAKAADDMAAGMDDATQKTQAQTDTVRNSGQAYADADERLKEYMADIESVSQADLSGAGAFGDDGSGGGAGGYGVARGLRAGAGIGRIAGLGSGSTQVFSGAADIIYLEQAFTKLGDTLPAILAPLDSFIAALEPFAPELLAIAAGIAVYDVALQEQERELKKGTEALQEAITAQDQYLKDSAALTTKEAENKRANSERDATGDQAIMADRARQIREQLGAGLGDMSNELRNKIIDEAKKVQAGTSGADLDQYSAAIKGVTGLGTILDDYDKAKKAATEAGDSVNFYTDGINKNAFAANDAAEAARKAATENTDQQKRFEAYDAATAKSDQQKVENLYSTIDSQQKNIALIEASNSGLDKNSEEYLKNKQAIENYQDQIKQETEDIQHLTEVSIPAAEKTQALTDADKQYLQLIDDTLAQTKRRADDEALTSQANADKTAKLREDRDTTQASIDALTQHSIVTDADQKKLDQLTAHLQDLDTEIGDLNQAFDPAKIREAADAIQKANDAYDKAVQSAQNAAATAIGNAQTQERQAEQQYTEGSIQDVYKRQQVQTAADRQRETDETDTANKIADVRTKLGEQELSITTDYNRQIFDDEIKYQQDFSKLQTTANDTAATDLQNHLNKLSQLRRDDHQNEADDIAYRDFQKLAKDQQTEQNKLSDENTSYSQREETLQTHLQQQESQLATNLANTEAQQQRAEQRKAADAITKSDQEIEQLNTDEKRKEQAIQTSEQQKLQDITTGENEQLAVLRQGLVNKITLIQIEENQREQIAQQTQQAIVANAHAMIDSLNQGFSTQLSQLNQLGKNGPAPIPSTYYNSANPGTYAGSTPAAPSVTTAPQQAQPQFSFQGVIDSLESGLQGLFRS